MLSTQPRASAAYIHLAINLLLFCCCLSFWCFPNFCPAKVSQSAGRDQRALPFGILQTLLKKGLTLKPNFSTQSGVPRTRGRLCKRGISFRSGKFSPASRRNACAPRPGSSVTLAVMLSGVLRARDRLCKRGISFRSGKFSPASRRNACAPRLGSSVTLARWRCCRRAGQGRCWLPASRFRLRRQPRRLSGRAAPLANIPLQPGKGRWCRNLK